MSSYNTENLIKSYKFLIERENTNSTFSLEELANATDWNISTVRTYISKKWDKLITKKGSKYMASGISAYTDQEYIKLMSQVNRNSSNPHKSELPIDVECLVIKARESALLSLDIYNRPVTVFKTEGFVVMMIIAWTSLFHAIFEK